jgi:protein translocase SecG subunit
MNYLAGLLTAVLVLDSFFLILLILVQLPKKEAGIGQAFGGGATDALFGAGTGNALTKLTKYAAGLFLALCLVLYVMGNQARKNNSTVRDELKKAGGNSVLPAAKTTPAVTPPAPAVVPPPASIISNTVATNLPAVTNAVVPKLTAVTNAAPAVKIAPSTNAPAKK